jgi:hypothetical protein
MARLESRSRPTVVGRFPLDPTYVPGHLLSTRLCVETAGPSGPAVSVAAAGRAKLDRLIKIQARRLSDTNGDSEPTAL